MDYLMVLIGVLPFLGIVGDFTGNNKEVDDDVDGLGNAYDAFGPNWVPPPAANTNDKRKRSEARNLSGF